MVQKEIAQGDLLFHTVHGVCRVDEIEREGSRSREALSYSLVPNSANKLKVRFVVPAASMKLSGFHVLISPKMAQEILECLKAGDFSSGSTEENQAWVLAKAIYDSSQDDLGLRDARKRQMLERSAVGLVGELAFVLKMTLKEAATSVKKSLGDPSQIKPMLLAALSHASEG